MFPTRQEVYERGVHTLGIKPQKTEYKNVSHVITPKDYVTVCEHNHKYNKQCYIIKSEPGSSVSIVSGYGLDDRAIEVRPPSEAKDFSSNLCVQTGSGAHPASCTMCTGGLFPGAKTWPGRDTTHSPHLVP
jgi:hypothetical protein